MTGSLLTRLLVLPLLAAGIAAAASPAPVPAPARRVPRTAAAFSPDGACLALAGYRSVEVREPAQLRLVQRLEGLPGKVTDVRFSPDGRWLAAATGQAGRSGEIRLWDSRTWTGRTFGGLHRDLIYAISWSPDSRTLAAGSYDRLVSLWEVGTGKSRTLKDHTDAVYSVAFSPDGRRLASASGDRTVKLWDVATGKRLYTLGDSTAELYSVAFHPSGNWVVAGGVDRSLRTWSVGPTSGALVRSTFAHDGAIVRLLYTADGKGIYTASEDRTVKLWDAETLEQRHALPAQSDWVLGLALSPDGRRLALGRYDGTFAVVREPEP